MDCLLHWKADPTHLFLVDVCQGLQSLGAEVFRHNEFESPFFEAARIQKIKQSSSSIPKGSLTSQALNLLKKCHEIRGSDPRNSELEIQNQASLLVENSIDLVITWSNAHPRPLATFLAAKMLGIRVFVLERGLVPGSYILARSQPWKDNLTTGNSLSPKTLSVVRSLSLEAFGSHLSEKYPTSEGESGRFDQDFPIGVFSGHAGAMGSRPDDYQLRVTSLLDSIELAHPESNILLRSHPGSPIHTSSPRVIPDNDSNLISALMRSHINVVDGSNVWVASLALEKPTILLDWQGLAGEESITVADFLDSISNPNAMDSLLEKSRKDLNGLLENSLSSEHFFHNADQLPGVEHLVSTILGGSELWNAIYRTAPTSAGASIWVSRKAYAERDALLTERDALLTERAALLTERDALLTERDALLTERDALLTERDALLTERAAIFSSKIWRWTRFLREPFFRFKSDN